MNQRISLHDLFQLRTNHFVPIGRLKLQMGPRDELCLDIKVLTSLSFLFKRTYMLFSFGDST